MIFYELLIIFIGVCTMLNGISDEDWPLNRKNAKDRDNFLPSKETDMTYVISGFVLIIIGVLGLLGIINVNQ